jgi:polyisoprenoid-binding protein YceI
METATEQKTAKWVLDKAHAKVGFSITHMLVSEIDGLFKDFDVKVENAKDDLSDAQIEFSANTASIDTHNETRNQHMLKDDFFDAAKYPLITFKSTMFRKIDARNYELNGDLTMHGVTKGVHLAVTGIIGEHPFNKKTIAGFKVTGTIKRSDFGLASAMPGIALSDEVNLVANAEFIKE